MLVTTVEKGSFLTLHYRLSGPDGADIVNTFNGPAATLSMGTQELAPAIQERLLGMAEGARAAFTLPPGAAFGQRNPDMVQRVKRTLLAQFADPKAAGQDDYQVGDVVQFPTPDGTASYAGLVRELGPDWLLFDFNHPLAGQSVTFDVHVIGVL
jgi:FKBP-type peptidyl-prolyl cis-trans isomerase SlpA